MKLCKRCNLEKALSDFFGNKKRKDGVSTYCKICQLEYQRSRYANPEVYKQRQMDRTEYLKNRKESVRKWYLKTTYGMTPGDYQRLFDSNDGKCWICFQPKDYWLHVDHNHVTGQIRGLLCNTCNRSLGLFKDDKNILRKAAEYLERFEDK